VTEKNTDQKVIDSILEGNSDAYRILVDKYQSFVYTLTVRILRDQAEAEEAAQDTFIKGYQALKNFSGKSKFSTWLYRIAFNTAISYKRKHRIEVSRLNDGAYNIAGSNSASDHINKEEQKKFINSALQRLTPADSAVITLFYKQEKSLDEISEITGLKISAIKVKLFRARKRLAEELRKQLPMEVESLL